MRARFSRATENRTVGFRRSARGRTCAGAAARAATPGGRATARRRATPATTAPRSAAGGAEPRRAGTAAGTPRSSTFSGRWRAATGRRSARVRPAAAARRIARDRAPAAASAAGRAFVVVTAARRKSGYHQPGHDPSCAHAPERSCSPRTAQRPSVPGTRLVSPHPSRRAAAFGDRPAFAERPYERPHWCRMRDTPRVDGRPHCCRCAEALRRQPHAPGTGWP